MKKNKKSPHISKYLNLCLQNDLPAAYSCLAGLSDPSADVRRFRRKVYERFYAEKPVIRFKTEDPLVKAVCLCYGKYLADVLTKRASPAAADKELGAGLSKTLKSKSRDIGELENQIMAAFKDRGYGFLGGVTSPYRGPYIWESSRRKTFDIRLPDRRRALKVWFLYGFVMRSWLDFATFGKIGPGGWTKKEGLYCVYDAYKKDMGGKAFEVSYLKHEAQHFSDNERFPGLDQTMLEYRAKLVELIYYAGHDRLLTFLAGAKNDDSLPHQKAEYLIVHELAGRFFSGALPSGAESWTALPYKQISRHCLELFQKNTERLCKGKRRKKIV